MWDLIECSGKIKEYNVHSKEIVRKKLIAELKNRQSQGESGLIIVGTKLWRGEPVRHCKMFLYQCLYSFKYDVHTLFSIIAGRDFVEESKQVGDTRSSTPEPMLRAFYKVKLVQMLGYGIPDSRFHNFWVVSTSLFVYGCDVCKFPMKWYLAFRHW